MSSGKRFLIILVAVSIAVWLIGSILLGPTGLSSDYLKEFGDDHERYLDIIKSTDYKLYEQRPHLHGPEQHDSPEVFAAQIAFVEEYKARPEYRAEAQRMKVYEAFFNVFNSLLLIVLLWRFARTPFLKFLDAGIEKIRERMETVSEARRKAELRLLDAKEKLSQLDAERSKIEADTEHRINSELESLEELNQQSLTILDLEYTDRKQHEFELAANQVKRDIVDEAMAQLEAQYRASLDAAQQADSLQQFMSDLLMHNMERKAS